MEAAGIAFNLDCTGSGGPTVVMDSGLGVPAMGWLLVQQDVQKFTRVCSYDRAGYGWSGAGPEPRTSDTIATELKALLDAAGEKGPYILVAHSFGGYNVRVFADKYPKDVVGMVLVDCSHEDQQSRMPPSLKAFTDEQMKSMKTQKILVPLMVRFGIVRLTAKDETLGKFPKELLQEASYLQRQKKYLDATFSELEYFSKSADEVRATKGLGDMPLVVLTAGKSTEELPPQISKEELKEFQKMWITDLQVKEAHLSTRGKQVVVEDSDHMIPMERPDMVVDAIKEVWTAVTAPAAAAPATVANAGSSSKKPN